ncbi:hypothetical protein [Vibrio coralliilyticus]|uniref:hypothetical protein n=1 Tax=Vibrio coralliilyticus TaxID=190893 RepID=UPI00155F8696|nr:hypothetical protein [Vibrio coralliilyticus]NRF16100.1 hypothetical protein [Vibrio coralliilyticus]
MKYIVSLLVASTLTGCLNLPEDVVWVDKDLYPAESIEFENAKKICKADQPLPGIAKMTKAIFNGESGDEYLEEAKIDLEALKVSDKCMLEAGYKRVKISEVRQRKIS